ncbi:hypothetical protein FACS1894133_7550 [Clostridia bacterium]|nr:hypothetical protein FACS1894133_7550 [Clostridia bacterium]
MNTSCLTTEQMADLAYCTEINDELREYNIHLMVCSECKETYSNLLTLSDMLKDLSLPKMRLLRNEIMFLKILLPIEKAKGTVAGAKKFIERINVDSLCLNVKTAGEALVGDVGNFLSFSPKYKFGYAGATSRGVGTSKNVIIDKNNVQNKVSVNENGGFFAELKLPANAAPPMIALVNKNSEVSIYEMTFNPQKVLWELSVFDLPFGEYNAIIAE